ncbi:MAG: type II toxin-antitoxin system Phd/YefM family antitoxin [Verrucomicrobiota bacterium]
MSTATYTEARDHLAELWDRTLATREPIVVTRRGKDSVAILPADELSSLMETAHLLRSPRNAERLLGALARSHAGEGGKITLEALAAKFSPGTGK